MVSRAPIFRAFTGEMVVNSDLPRMSNGRFVAGHSYSKKTQIGPRQHLSATTEFRGGRATHNKLPVGSVRIRKETHSRLFRAWVKTAEPNVWRKRAVVIWEAIHGPLPKGSVVHHEDRNSLNDDPDNLRGLTRKEHNAEHRLEIAIGAMKAALS